MNRAWIVALALLAGCGSAAPRARTPPARPTPEPAAVVVLPFMIGTGIYEASFTPDGRTLLAAGGGVVYALDPRTLGVRGAVHASGGVAYAGASVLVGDRIWDVALDRVRLLQSRPRARSSSVSPRQDRVARLYDESVVLIDLERGTEHELPIDAGMERVRFVGDDRLLAYGYRAGSVLLDASSGRVVARFDPGPIVAHATLPLLVREVDRARIVVHDASDGRVLREIESPDPERLLLIDWEQDADGQILGYTRARGWGGSAQRRAWDAATGAPVEPSARRQARSARVPGSNVTYYVSGDGCALMREDGDGETVVVEGDEALREDSCSPVVISADGTIGAFAQGPLFTFDAVSGEILAAAEAPTELGSCGEIASSIEHGLSIPLDAHDHRFGGCTPEPHHEEDEYVGEDIESSGVVGRSPNGRYVVDTRPTDDEESNGDEWEASLVVRDTQAGDDAEGHAVADLTVRCMYTRDQTPEGGWYSSDECTGQAFVSDDGATLYFHHGEPRVSVVDLRTGRRRDIPVPSDRGFLEMLAPGVLLFDIEGRSGALIRVEDGSVMPSTSRIARSPTGLVVVTSTTALRIVDPRTFTAREIARDASAERWAFSADGSMLVRQEPGAPLARVEVATGALLDPVELPEGFDPSRAILTEDARSLVQCIDGEVRSLALDDGSVRAIAEDPGCTAHLSVGFGSFVAIAHPSSATLVRMADGARISLEPIVYGQRLLWIARSDDGHFWAPADALDELGVRPAGDLEAELEAAEQSPLYREDLLAGFLGLLTPSSSRAR